MSSSAQPLLLGLSLAESVAEARTIIAEAKAEYPHVATVALFSGGADSTTLLHLCADQIDFALHVNTGIGIESTREFVRQTCDDWRIPLVEKRTDPAWYRADVVKRGFPGPAQHSIMYHNLKRARLRELRRELSQKRGDSVLLLTGERVYESRRRMGYGSSTTRIMDGGIWVNPIHFFTDWHMREYQRVHVLENCEASDLMHKSGECLCGAYAHRFELTEMEMWFPETAAYIHDLEHQAAQAGHGKRAQWAWGSASRKRTSPPGPLCQSCHLFPEYES